MFEPKLLTASFFITWIIGPFLMFFTGDILFERSRIHDRFNHNWIAPLLHWILVWNELLGNRELTAGLIGINSLLQVFFFSLYAYFFWKSCCHYLE
jgi:ACR3 family arsenite transporter